MPKIIVSTFITLDGVFESPEQWSMDFQSPDAMESALGLLQDSEALLLGRRTYDGFAEAWPGREDPMGFAEKMNGMPKHVVSTTLTDPEWNNTTVIADDIVAQVTGLKESAGGNLLLYGSATLMRSLIAANLIDEIRLLLAPIVVGQGAHLFPDDTPQSTFSPTSSTILAGGLIALTLEPVSTKA